MTADNNEPVQLRAATIADAFDIHRLVWSNALNPMNLDWRRFTVAIDTRGRVVGCGQIRNHGSVDELASLVVARSWQGRGVSALLMQTLLERGRRPLWLMCESDLLPLYRRYGFVEIKSPTQMPLYFQTAYWPLRITLAPVLATRGTHLAYMVLDAGG